MPRPSPPPDEAERLQALRALELLDTQPEERFDRITRLARQLFHVEIALICLVDEHRQWFKSRQGLAVDETARDIAFCAHTIQREAPFVVEDTAHDERFSDNPLVLGAPYIQFYAGVPLHAPNGKRIGSLCVIDSKARRFDDADIQALADLRAVVESELGARIQERAMSEMKEAEHRVNAILRRSNAELQTIIDNMPAMVGYWDAALQNRFGNRAYLDWFGYTADQMRGMAMRDVIGAEAFERNLPLVEAALKGEPRIYERPLVDRHGVTRQMLVSYVPDKAEDTVHGFYIFGTDLTLLRNAQADRIRAQAQLQTLIDAASEFSIIATDLQGRIRVFSVGAERMLGYSAAELVDHETPVRLHLAAEVEARAAELSAQTGRPVAGFDVFTGNLGDRGTEAREWTYVRKDGSHVPVRLVVTVIRDGDGRASGYLGIAQDITQQKELQASLMAAKEQAESASRAKSEFVANMSHEIRTPMNAVLGMTHLLSGTALSAEQKKYLDMIRLSGQSLLGILNDILDFSKIEAGRMELADAPFRLAEVLTATASVMAVNASDKDLELAICVAPEVPAELVGDALRLQQVLINLTGNAIKFTQQGEVIVHVDCVRRGPDAIMLRIAVSDTGIGMDEAQLARLFGAFSQADASMTRRFGGTGLGLAICKRLVEQMGGAIEVNSVLGRGTTFRVDVPLQAPVKTGVDKASNPDTPLRLLLVDDSPIARRALAQAAQACGAHLDSTDSDVQARALLQAARAAGTPYDAVLIDWQMPDAQGSGLTVLQALHRELADSGSLCVAASNTYGRGKLLQDQTAQADAILIKPVTSLSLLDTLEPLLSERDADTHSSFDGAPGSLRHRLDGARLLLVEDNPVNEMLARSLLENAGAAVDSAENGQLAVDALRARPDAYDAVLMDVQMPIMDGFTATRMIRDVLQLKLPVLAMTAGVMASEQARCKACGMNDFIAKPIDIEQMFAVLLRHLPSREDRARHRATAVAASSSTPPLKAFEPDALLALMHDNPAARGKLLGLVENMLIDGPRQLAHARAAWQENRIPEAAQILHKMRGAFGALGAKRFAQAALTLEHALRGEVQASDTPPTALFEALDQAQQEVLAMASAWLEKERGR